MEKHAGGPLFSEPSDGSSSYLLLLIFYLQRHHIYSLSDVSGMLADLTVVHLGRENAMRIISFRPTSSDKESTSIRFDRDALAPFRAETLAG